MGVSCCGEAKGQPSVVTNSQPFLGAGPGIIDSQPTYQPVLNYNNNASQPPTVPSPPIAYDPFSSGPMREFRATSPSQQSAAHSTFSGTVLYNGQPPFQQPTFTGTTYNNGQPPLREFGASSPPQQQTALPTLTGTTYNGSNFNSTITRPKSSHSPTSPPPQVNSPKQDEGKMSISIDFGVYPHVISLYSLILVQVQHSLVL